MFKALKAAFHEDQSLSRARIELLKETLFVQGMSGALWPIAVAAVFYLDKDLGPIATWRILLWLCAIWSWSGLALVFHHHVRSSKGAEKSVQGSSGIFCFVYLLDGLAWALFVGLVWVDNNAFNNTLTIIIILGLSVGFGFQLTAHFGVFLCAVLPPFAMEYARMAQAHSDYLAPYLVLSPAFTIWMIGLSFQLNKQVGKTLKTAILNRRLAEDLRTARDSAVGQKILADSASQAKSQFLANMSHELRTPLNAIIGFSEIIKGLVYGPAALPKYVEYAGDIELSGRHLLSLINQILDLAKVEAGKLVLARETLRLDEVVGECINLLQMTAADKGIQLSFDNKVGALTVEADSTALRQVFLNILGNAVKFTDKGGVRVTASLDGAAVAVSIEDTGPGISKEDLPRIFEPFEQADNSLSRAKGGSGLGLAIVAKLIEAHGGACTVVSRVGEGTVFTVRLPVSKANIATRTAAA